MTVPSVTITEATGGVAAAAPPVDKVVAVFGPCSAHASNAPAFYGKAQALYTANGYGPGVRACANVIARTSRAQIFVPLPSTNAGTYGTPDVTGVTGTADITAGSTNPYDTYEAKLVVTTGGTLGTTGIKLKWSLDGGRNLSAPVALGIAGTYTIPNSNVSFAFNPDSTDLTNLYTLINELYTDINAHVILTAGSVHGAADNADVTSIASATTIATAVARINALKAAYELHRVKTSSSIHGLADSTNAVSAATATDATTALALALDLKTKYNAHRVLTTGSVHGAADSTNATTTTGPSHGTLVAGDVVTVSTIGPKWATSDLTTAATTLAQSSLDCSIIEIAGTCSATEAASVTTMLDSMAARGKRCIAVITSRPQASGETEADWIASVASDFSSFSDDRIVRVDGTALCTFEEPGGTRIYTDSPASHEVSEIVNRDISESLSAIAFGPIPGVTLVNTGGTLIGHDEAEVGGFDEARGVALYRVPDVSHRIGAYVSHPYVLKADVGRIFELQVRRVANALERTAKGVALDQIGVPEVYDPRTGTITAQAAESIANAIKDAISSAHARDFANPKDDNLVVVSRSVTVSGDAITVYATINFLPFKYIQALSIDFSVQV